VVIGHASERTKDLPIATHKLVNFKISGDGAQAVAKQLMRHGVQASAIVIEARGANDPLYFEWMPKGEAENRRADIYLQY
jgi:flagellar motor protein MotB